MPHINTEPGQIDQTITAFIVRLDGDEPKALFHMHKKYSRLLPVGGHVELDETPWAAVAHEILEESGYDFDQLEIMQPKLRIDSLTGVVNHPQLIRENTHMAAPNHYHSDRGYLFVTNEEPRHEPDDGESKDLRWLTKNDLLKLNDNEIFPDARQTVLLVFDKFLDAWEAVPTDHFPIKKDL